MQNIGMRFLIAVLFVWIGINLVAYGMTENGTASNQNPVWRMMKGFLDFEWEIGKGILYLAGFGLVIFIIMLIVTSVTKEPSDAKIVTPRYKSESFKSSVSVPQAQNSTDRSPILKDENPPVQKSYLISTSVLPEEFPEPKPRALTPDELKKKAIKQIMERR